MKKMYYLEICDSPQICGGVYPLGEYTEKQALKECKRRIKELWRSDKNLKRIEFHLCEDEDAFDVIFSIELFKGDIRVYDYRTEECIEDTLIAGIDKGLKELDESLAKLDESFAKIEKAVNIIVGSHEKND